MPSESTTRIAKNTALLYVRMFLIMAVTLYTSRVILNVLGVEDYGIYNVVGGVVVMFSFLNNAMSTATQRFLNFELGKSNIQGVERVFSMSMTAHITIALLMIFFAETLGLWILNSYLNIPPERMKAAQWVYQLSLLTLCVNVLRVPYNASIIAYEKMSFYAYVSIVEVILKLAIVFLLQYAVWDRLIYYAFLLLCVTVVINAVYRYYCRKTFTTCRYHYFWDSSLYKELMSFSGWSLFGSVANVGVQQGIGILLNIFIGVVTNAALGIANQVNGAINQFVSNFQIAFRPQLVKSYAAGNRDYFLSLIFQSSRFSYLLLFLLALPICICTPFILKLWLGIVPEYTVSFCRWMIVFSLIDAISAPLWMSVQAIGRIRNYQILMSILICLNLPFSYGALLLGVSANWVLIIRAIINALTYVVRIFYLKKKIALPIKQYVHEVVTKTGLVSLVALPIPLLCDYYLEGWMGFLITMFVSFCVTGVLTYYVGMKSEERRFLINKKKKKY